MTAVDTFVSTSCKQHVVTFKDASQIAQAHTAQPLDIRMTSFVSGICLFAFKLSPCQMYLQLQHFIIINFTAFCIYICIRFSIHTCAPANDSLKCPAIFWHIKFHFQYSAIASNRKSSIVVCVFPTHDTLRTINQVCPEC